MNDLLDRYVRQHIDAEPAALHEIDRDSNLHLINGRMCSGHIQGRLLKMLTSMINPKRVLELGTFSGYSALCMAEALTGDATLDTIEVNDELEDVIRRNLASMPCGERITLHIGDAAEIMHSMPDHAYDLIFIDADKRCYVEYYHEALRLVHKGGFIIADNTLWDGHVVDPGYLNDRQTKGVCEFNDLVGADERVEKVIIPLRDGITLIRKL